MVIELFGLPGAGKSTLAKELSEKLPLPVVRLSLFWRIIHWKMSVFQFPREAFSVVRFLFRHGRTHLCSFFMNGCVDRYGRFAYARKHGGILDEGPLQNVLSFPSRTLFEREMDAIVASLPHPDVLIHVSADQETRRNRQVSRGRITRDGVWESYASENERLALSALPPKVLVLRYPEMSASEIVEHIRAL
jgi:adenylate kinase family enzyme